MKFNVDFIGIGSWKCGTTWLAYVLRQHPEICFSYKKEPQFFNEKRINGRPNFNYEKGINFYRSNWPKKIPKGSKIGEFTPTYLPDQAAPKRIKKHFPKVKLIIMLRDPIEKAFSIYRSRKNFGTDIPGNITFEKMFEKHPNFVNDCMYYSQLSLWYKLFPRNQIKVILLENVKKNPAKVAKEVFNYIGIDSSYGPDVTPQNVTPVIERTAFATIRNQLLNIPIYIYRSLEKIIPRKTADKLFHSRLAKKYAKLRMLLLFRKKGKAKPVLQKKTQKKLYKFFEKDINKVEKLIKLNLSIWRH